MLKNAFKFMVLIPVNPMRYIREFELIPRQKGTQWLIFLFAFLLLIGSYSIYIFTKLSLEPEYAWGEIFFTFIIFKIFSIFLFLMFLLILSFMRKLEVHHSRIFALLAFTFVLDIFPVLLAIIDLQWAFYLFWLILFWKVTIVSLGMFIFGEGTITQSIVVSVIAATAWWICNDLFFLS